MIWSTQLLYLFGKMPSRNLNCFAMLFQLLSYFSQQSGWRTGMPLALHAQGLRFDPHQLSPIFLFIFFHTYIDSDLWITVFKIRISKKSAFTQEICNYRIIKLSGRKLARPLPPLVPTLTHYVLDMSCGIYKSVKLNCFGIVIQLFLRFSQPLRGCRGTSLTSYATGRSSSNTQLLSLSFFFNFEYSVQSSSFYFSEFEKYKT